MNKSTLISIICVGAGLILIGLGIGLVKGDFMKFNGKSTQGNWVNATYECSSNIDHVDIDERSEATKVVTGNVDKPVISYWYYEKEADRVEITEKSGTLHFERKDRKEFSFGPIVSFNVQDTCTLVTLPRDYKGKIEVTASSGSVFAEGISNDDDIRLEASSGYVHAESINCKDFELKASSGSIKAEDIVADGEAKLSNTSGSISAKKMSIKDDFSVKNSSGSIKLSEVTCKDLNAENTSGGVRLDSVTAKKASLQSSSGSVKFEDTTFEKITAKTTSGGVHFEDLTSDEIELRAHSGSIRGNIKGNENDYSIISSTGSGSCNLSDSRNGSKKLDVSTTSGGIHISFD